MPSPHTATHVYSPATNTQLGSLTQAAVQPSNGVSLQSSHCSLPSLSPSWQVVSRQAAPAASQSKPGSSVQLGAQASPASVLASSQRSPPAMMPSPHTGWHFAPGKGQAKPASSAHSVQPSFGAALP